MAKRKVRATTLAEWLVMCEQAIAWHTTPPRTRGKYKGHGSTDSVAWMTAMLKLMQADIRRTRKGIGYDENMALASLAGLVFAAVIDWCGMGLLLAMMPWNRRAKTCVTTCRPGAGRP